MAQKDWWETMNPGDCLKDGTWEDMTNYIQHSACTDFTIYSQCTDTNPVFKFGGNNDIEFDGDRAIMIDNDKTYIGHGAGDGITTGTGNTLIGHDAGLAMTDEDNCVCVGVEAGENNTQSNIVAVGYHALQNNTGQETTAVGYDALGAACTGNGNTALGNACLDANTSGSANTGLGNYSLTAVKTGHSNTGGGAETMIALTSGYNNTAVGYQAGRNASFNSFGCVYLGKEAGRNNATDNALYINNSNSAFPLIYGEFANDIVEFGNSNDAFFLKFSHDANDSIVETPTNDRSIFLKPHGTGYVKFGTYVATPATDSTGYIIIKDSGGTERKVMIQA